MAYSDDLNGTNTSNRWPLNSDGSNDEGGITFTLTSITFSTSNPLCEDQSGYAVTNADGDSMQAPTSTGTSGKQFDIVYGGWFRPTNIDQPFVRIAGDGNASISLALYMGIGNTIMAEVDDGTNVYQVISDTALVPGRAYHIAFGIENAGGGDFRLFLWLDGFAQGSFLFSTGTPAARTVGFRLGGSSGTTDFSIGGTNLKCVSSKNGEYAQWASWEDSNADIWFLGADVTPQRIIVGKGAIPDVEVTATSTDSYVVPPQAIGNKAVGLRINQFSNADHTIDVTGVTWDDACPINVIWTGQQDLTLIVDSAVDLDTFRAYSSNTPERTVTVVKSVDVAVTVKDASTLAVIQGARVRIEAAVFSYPLPIGTVILEGLTDALGQVTGTMQYIDNQEYIVKVRKGTSSPLYSPAQGAGVIGSAGLDATVLLVGDE